MLWQVKIAQIEISNIRLEFLEIIEFFEVYGNLIYCICERD